MLFKVTTTTLPSKVQSKKLDVYPLEVSVNDTKSLEMELEAASMEVKETCIRRRIEVKHRQVGSRSYVILKDREEMIYMWQRK